MKLKTLLITLLILMIVLPLNIFATTASSDVIYDGIDVSDWQGYINYSAVKASGIDVVYIKASQGDNIVDSYFKINYNDAKENGLKVGFYHYLTDAKGLLILLKWADHERIYNEATLGSERNPKTVYLRD